LDAYTLLISCILRVSGIFQKPPGGWWTIARQLILFLCNFGFL